MPRKLSLGIAALLVTLSPLAGRDASAAPILVDVRAIAAPINTVQMEYSAPYGKLILRNSASAIAVVDTATGANQGTRLANSTFTDISLTADQRYLYAADYGGTNIGYGTALGTQYVHRYDAATGTWDSRTSLNPTYHVEGVDGSHVIVAAIDQWITLTYDAWGTGPEVTPLGNSAAGTFFPGYYASLYRGDIEYDATTGRLIHGNSGLSSQEIAAFRITGDNFVPQETSGTYGSAQGYGGSAVLSTDSRFFYYGRLQVDALDVTHNQRVFPEVIIAASGLLAFGASGNYYDAVSGALLGNLGFATSAIALNHDGTDLWAYKSSDASLHYFVTPEARALPLLGVALALLAAVRRTTRRAGAQREGALEGAPC